MKLQIGYDNFGKVRANNLNFIDKTLFLKEILDNNEVEVSVITRPRRFGKTFNLSTLHCFLAAEVYGQKTKGLFDDLKISKVDHGSYMRHQGQYPVILVTFKNIKESTFENAFAKFKILVQELYRTHQYLLQSANLTEHEKKIFTKYIDGEISKVEAENALHLLSELVSKHYGKNSWLLIDEYDTPIQSGYLNNYYNDMIGLMRSLFGAALKSNPYLERAVITGILRVAKESLFSGINNLRVCSVLQSDYSEHFGFTENEVTNILRESHLSDKEQDIKKWYNGYVFGGTTVYNPWSIVNCIKDEGVLKPYWVNTSDNSLIRGLITKSSTEFKEQVELLLQGKTVTKSIDENMVFGDLKHNSSAVWSLLLMSGYLTVASPSLDVGNTICDCYVPNLEVKMLYRDIIQSWLGNGHGIGWYQSFLTYLLDGNIEKFTLNFGQILAQTISVHDVAHNPEAFYHGFMLGLAAGLDQKQYEVKSNRESGLGRYDIAIIPKDILKPAIILEIKSIVPPKTSQNIGKILTKEAHKALKQINRNQYTLELIQRGSTNIVKIGLAFSGKEFRVAAEK